MPTEPVDVVLRNVARELTKDWPDARRDAALAATLEGRTLVKSAGPGQSRESVRRARERLIVILSHDHRAERAAAALFDVIGDAQDQADLAALAPSAVSDLAAWPAVLRTLRDAGFGPASAGRGAKTLADGRPANAAELDQTQGSGCAAELLASGQARALTDEWLALPQDGIATSPAGRAMRRLVTMTGPLPWPDLLVAWARAGGRPPHGPLPPDVQVLTAWLTDVPGLRVRASTALAGHPVVEAADPPVGIDQVSSYLLTQMKGIPAGVERAELLERAGDAGLRPASIAAALTYHPAVISPVRGRWALRTSPEVPTASPTGPLVVLPAPRRRPTRSRPTSYTWAPSGELVLEFSAPPGPSPVVAIPAAVADLLDAVSFTVPVPGRDDATVTSRQARLWGFGPALTELGIGPGERVELICDLVAERATVVALRKVT